MMVRIFIAILCLSLLACQDEEVLRAPGLSTPIVTGMQFTNNQGLILLDWGKSNEKREDFSANCGRLQLVTFPNPAFYIFNIQINYSDCNTLADVWITPAQLSDDLQSNQFNFSNANLARPGGFAIKTLLHNEPLTKNSFHWDGTNDQGQEVSPGFYRIYVQIDNTLLWRDILLIRDADDIPLFLKKMLPI